MSFQKAIVITTLGSCPNLNISPAKIDCVADGGGPVKKRRRLTHLSANEKMLRRKMKNRIAAQTARDRKKAKLEELEGMVAELMKEREQLLKDNAELKRNKASMEKENQHLKCKTSVASAPTPKAVASPSSLFQQPLYTSLPEGKVDNTALPYMTEPECPGSAALIVSLPKEHIQELSCAIMQIASCALTLSLILSCIYWKKSAPQWKSPAPSWKGEHLEPAQRVLANLGSEKTVECGALTEPWWGPQQQMWTPSKK
ncbi:uncharacterized protein LOC143288451 isoform X2 [Babylonia areolata]|uniref:uncharacterized protein LOC143288451 isoform X2 n=1 Tax=Babylonia areolata TaxID=304850 RepID=UPI003FD4882A